MTRAKPRAPATDGRLTPSAWEVAALEAIAAHGLAGVAVEPLARALGVTKGSFYWHFADRDALLAASLQRWETSTTDRIIASLAGISDPRDRLRQLIRTVLVGGISDRLHIALAASSDPRVRAAVARVTRRRLAYLEASYVELGQPPREAERSALIAYTAYVGLVHLRVEAPDELPGAKSFAALLDQLAARLVP